MVCKCNEPTTMAEFVARYLPRDFERDYLTDQQRAMSEGRAAANRALDNALEDECAVKHCDEPATLGMTWRFGNVSIEFEVCEAHFDEISAVDEVGPPEAAK